MAIAPEWVIRYLVEESGGGGTLRDFATGSNLAYSTTLAVDICCYTYDRR